MSDNLPGSNARNVHTRFGDCFEDHQTTSDGRHSGGSAATTAGQFSSASLPSAPLFASRRREDALSFWQPWRSYSIRRATKYGDHNMRAWIGGVDSEYTMWLGTDASILATRVEPHRDSWNTNASVEQAAHNNGAPVSIHQHSDRTTKGFGMRGAHGMRSHTCNVT